MTTKSNSIIITTVATKIREARKENQLSQDELAEKVGLTRVSINQLENGRGKTIKPQNIQKIAEILEKPETYFYSAATQSTDSLPDPLRAVVTRLFTLPRSQQEQLGRIIEQVVNWYEAEIVS